jgi:WD40 repeat protein
VAVGDRKGFVHAWDVPGRTKLWSVEPKGLVSDLAFDPTGETIVCYGFWGQGRLLDAATGAVRATLERTVGGSGWRADLSPDGRWFATIAFNRPPELWELSTHESRLVDVDGRDFIATLAFAPDSSLFAFGSAAGDVVLWDLGRQAPRSILSYGAEPTSMAFSPDGRRLAVSGEAPVKIWEVASGSARELGETEEVAGLQYAPDGRRLAGVGIDRATVILWDPESGRRRVFRGHEKDPIKLVFVAGGARLMSGSPDGTIYVWDNDLGDLPNQPGALRAWFAQITSAVVAPGGKALTP